MQKRRLGKSNLEVSALGLGFMFFEITLIQRLTLFLGYPTYSLTVTLAAILVSTGIGALLSRWFAGDPARAVHVEPVGPDQNVTALDVAKELRPIQALIIADIRALVYRYGSGQTSSNRQEANVKESCHG